MYFEPGQTCVSKKADEVLSVCEIVELIDRHVTGDYGEFGTIDEEIMFEHGHNIVSLYSVRGYKVFIITDSNREYTRVMLCDEY